MSSVRQAPGADKTACDCSCAGACSICVTVTVCNASTLAGATVTVTGPARGTCTTDAAGACCVDVGAGGSGTYTVTASKAGYLGSSRTVAVTCPPGAATTLSVEPVATNGWLCTVKGCNGLALPGAKVAINGGSYTTDASGQVRVSLPLGTFPWSISRSRFVTATGSVTRSSCATGVTGTSVTLDPDADHVCCLSDAPTPIARTLQLTGGGGTIAATTEGSCLWYFCGTESPSPTSASANQPAGFCNNFNTPLEQKCRPTDLGAMNVAVGYKLEVASTSSVSVSQYVPCKQTIDWGSLIRTCCALGFALETCAAYLARCAIYGCEFWYWSFTDCDRMKNTMHSTPPGPICPSYTTYPTASFSIISVEPFAAVVTLAPGSGMFAPQRGGFSDCTFTPTGQPTTSTVAISE